MNYRNPAYNQYGTIDCEYEHPEYGWIPFTASADDDQIIGRELYRLITTNGNIAAYDPSTDASIEDTRAMALREIDAIASTERGRIIVTGSGQELIYMKKEVEAYAFRTNGYPETSISEYPYIQGHSVAMNVTGREAADAIITQAEAWEQIGLDIENERIRAKRLIREATEITAFSPIVNDFRTTIGGMVDALLV